MSRTKKVEAAGRFGPRYGRKVRKLFIDTERKLRRKYKCSNCGALQVKRVSTSIWQCKRCGVKFAGGAYSPSMPTTSVETTSGGRSDVEV
ncbi:MAG TPA: 50S ribosomal protein L37Ae [Hadesarchaea archaeon]|nr:50S ribosomal protein L37Ae [Hadesarchaea archaeon]